MLFDIIVDIVDNLLWHWYGDEIYKGLSEPQRKDLTLQVRQYIINNKDFNLYNTSLREFYTLDFLDEIEKLLIIQSDKLGVLL